jgi:hypothetical protein
VGFALTETSILAGTDILIHYRSQFEASYCTEGEAEGIDTLIWLMVFLRHINVLSVHVAHQGSTSVRIG